MHSTESRCVMGPKMYCLLARPCIIQPGNFTCWGSDGVKQAQTNKETKKQKQKRRLCDILWRRVRRRPHETASRHGLTRRPHETASRDETASWDGLTRRPHEPQDNYLKLTLQEEWCRPWFSQTTPWGLIVSKRHHCPEYLMATGGQTRYCDLIIIIIIVQIYTIEQEASFFRVPDGDWRPKFVSEKLNNNPNSNSSHLEQSKRCHCLASLTAIWDRLAIETLNNNNNSHVECAHRCH